LEEPFSANFLGLRRESSALLIGKLKSLSAQLLPQGSSCWCRLTQPAKISIRNRSGRAFVSPSLSQRGPKKRAEIADSMLA
jgi:hypothetical protein